MANREIIESFRGSAKITALYDYLDADGSPIVTKLIIEPEGRPAVTIPAPDIRNRVYIEFSGVNYHLNPPRFQRIMAEVQGIYHDFIVYYASVTENGTPGIRWEGEQPEAIYLNPRHHRYRKAYVNEISVVDIRDYPAKHRPRHPNHEFRL